MEKLFIKNRQSQKISVTVENPQKSKGLVFVMHGLGGFKEQDHIQTFASAFREKGYTIVLFDTTNSFGESDGKYEDATITNYYEDLEDVIKWSENQKWYQEPFILTGHSLGGFCIAYYAENYPEKVLAVAPISPFISGKLSLEAHEKHDPEELKKWKETGWMIRESYYTKSGMIKKLPWFHMEDRLKYDLLPKAKELKMPVLLIVGEKDTSIPPEHIQKLFNILPGKKDLHIIKNAPHTFREQKYLKEIKGILSNWIAKIN